MRALTGRATSRKQLTVLNRHPFGAREVTFEGAPRTNRLSLRVDVQDETRDLPPISVRAEPVVKLIPSSTETPPRVR